MEFPASEIEWWSLYFSLENDKDFKYIPPNEKLLSDEGREREALALAKKKAREILH